MFRHRGGGHGSKSNLYDKAVNFWIKNYRGTTDTDAVAKAKSEQFADRMSTFVVDGLKARTGHSPEEILKLMRKHDRKTNELALELGSSFLKDEAAKIEAERKHAFELGQRDWESHLPYQ